jgi:hypothetical protein
VAPVGDHGGIVGFENVGFGALEAGALAAVARERRLRTHMDGARFANAVQHLGCAPADVTWRAGVDMLSFGCIKNGGMSAEALVVFDPAVAGEGIHTITYTVTGSDGQTSPGSLNVRVIPGTADGTGTIPSLIDKVF